MTDMNVTTGNAFKHSQLRQQFESAEQHCGACHSKMSVVAIADDSFVCSDVLGAVCRWPWSCRLLSELKRSGTNPAHERGLLTDIQVEPVSEVHQSQELASWEGNGNRLAVQLAEIDLSLARKRSEDAVSVQVAEAVVNESSKLSQQAKLEQ